MVEGAIRILILSSALAGCGTAPLCSRSGGACEGPIVDQAWLQEAIAADEDVQIIDVRPPEAFAAGHAPGALSLDVESLRVVVDGVDGQVAPAATVEGALRAAGVRAGAHVVVLADEVTPDPARVVWTLHQFGHPRASLLQGGWSTWTGAEEAGPPASVSGDFVAGESAAPIRVDAAWMLAHLNDPAVALIDARTPEEFAAGHIPGALAIDWQENIEDGALRGDQELASLYAAIDREQTVVTYCKSGMRAALTYVVLLGLGYGDVRLYDGSWNEWGARPDLPKEI